MTKPEQIRSRAWWFGVMLSIWLLSLACLSLPGRESPESIGDLDVVALFKVAVRGGVFLVLGLAVFVRWRDAKRPFILSCFLPFAIFVAWAAVSVAWSPLRTVTIGQTLGLIDLYLLALAVALGCHNTADRSRVLFHLSAALLAFSTLILSVDLLRHDLSGLDRNDWGELEGAWSGMTHPTTAGATSSLGLLMTIALRALCGWRWTRVMFLPGCFVHGPLLIFSQSRMALVTAALALLFVVLSHTKPKLYLTCLLTASLLGTALLVIDPGLRLSEAAVNQVGERFRRGESNEQLAGFNGRTDMWAAIWESYEDSPLVGHGYFVTSRTGEIDIWNVSSNHTAHNTVLQVMVSTGLIGLLLFIWGLWRPIQRIMQCTAACTGRRLSESMEHSIVTDSSKKLLSLITLVAVWYLVWGLLSESFMGPVQPESVVFFSLLGLAVSLTDAKAIQSRRQRTPSHALDGGAT